jgi:glycosyltransferase involved in cell wall biosynthesis
MNLYLFTYQFPFGSGEPFVDDELNVLVEHFESVTIIPSRALFNPIWRDRLFVALPSKTLPPNVHVWLPPKLQPAHLLKNLVLFVKATWLSALPRIKSLRAFGALVRSTLKAVMAMSVLQTLVPNLRNSVCYTYWKDEGAALLCALYRMQLLTYRPITRCHGIDLYYDLPNTPVRPFDPLIAETAGMVAVVSEMGRAHLEAHAFSGKTIKVARLGVEIPVSVSSPSDRAAKRIIVSCSRMVPLKRVPFIAKCLTLLKEPIEWHHFGWGPDADSVKLHAANLPPDSVVLHGDVPRSEVFNFYSISSVDLFLNMSVTEGVPVSIMEALAFGIPVIATDVGGISELIDNDVGALISSEILPQEVAKIISHELQEGCSEKRRNARARAERMCDASANYRLFAREIVDTVGSNGPSAERSLKGLP